VKDLGPIQRTPVSEAVFDRLRDEIVSGRAAAGSPLPSERALSERLGVNRHAVREALKRLQQAGLVLISQGGATRVLDWRAHAGLDLLPQLIPSAGVTDPGVIRAAFEMRVSIGADAAARCAQRATAEQVRELRRRLGELAAAGDDLESLDERYVELWEVVVDGADNVAYRLALNSLVAGAAVLGDLSKQLHAEELRDRDGHARLVDAIADRDATGAEDAARALLSRTLAAVLARSSGGRGGRAGLPEGERRG
jgi:DNA-binding FadR family transcriptional regulator